MMYKTGMKLRNKESGNEYLVIGARFGGGVVTTKQLTGGKYTMPLADGGETIELEQEFEMLAIDLDEDYEIIPQHGGARKGAGRRYLNGSEPGKGSPALQVSITVTANTLEQARELGDGNVSEGFRRAVETQRASFKWLEALRAAYDFLSGLPVHGHEDGEKWEEVYDLICNALAQTKVEK